jgi:hypothetical protein
MLKLPNVLDENVGMLTRAMQPSVGAGSAAEWAMLRAAAAEAVTLAARAGQASHRFRGWLVQAHRVDSRRPHGAVGVDVEVAWGRSGQVVAREVGAVLPRGTHDRRAA